MTVSTSSNKVTHAADGIQLIFAYNYLILDESHIKVYVDNELKTLTTDYTVDGVANPAGGNVTFLVAPANGTQVTLLRQVPITQLIDYQEYDPFPAETHERGLDLGVMISQQQQEELDRTLKAPIYVSESVDYTLPAYDAGKALMWTESDPKGITNSTDDFNDIVTDATAAKVAAQAAQALAEAAQAAAELAQTGAETAETNAETAETNAEAWAEAAAGSDPPGALHGSAKAWAETAEDTLVDGTGYSALHWAAKSEGFADDSAAAAADVEATLSIATSTISWDWATQSELAKVTLTEDATLNMISDFDDKLAGLLRVIQDGTGGWTLALNAGYDPGLIALDPPTDADAEIIFGFYKVGAADVRIWEVWRSA